MNYLSRHCRSISPYTAGEQPRDKSYVKLNTNECPYPPSPAVEKTLREYEAGDLRLYPDPDCTELRAVIAEKYGLAPQNVFVGNGSDEVLALCFPTFFDEGDEVAFADVTYTFYKVWAHAFGVKARVIPVDKELKLDPEDYLALPDSVRGVIICNPNAPTGMPMPRADIVRIAEQNSERVVIVDEAYCDFSQESMIGMLNELPNLVVVKTLSKAYALAGARCGFALASPEIVDGLNTIKNSFNSYTVNALTQKLAAARKPHNGIDNLRIKPVFHGKLPEELLVVGNLRYRRNYLPVGAMEIFERLFEPSASAGFRRVQLFHNPAQGNIALLGGKPFKRPHVDNPSVQKQFEGIFLELVETEGRNPHFVGSGSLDLRERRIVVSELLPARVGGFLRIPSVIGHGAARHEIRLEPAQGNARILFGADLLQRFPDFHAV